MLSKITLIILITVSCYVYAEEVRFRPVKSVGLFWKKTCNKHVTIEKVDITPCQGNGRACGVQSDVETTMKITFKTKALRGMSTDKLKIHICGWKVFCLPLILTNNDACDGRGLACPLEDNTSYTFSITLPISSHYPKIRVKAEFRLYNDDGEYLVCLNVPLEIV